MPTDSSSTICRLTAQISTRSKGFGNLPGGNAYTTDTSHYSARSPIPSRRNLHSGQAATLPCVDYAQLLKTLCLNHGSHSLMAYQGPGLAAMASVFSASRLSNLGKTLSRVRPTCHLVMYCAGTMNLTIQVCAVASTGCLIIGKSLSHEFGRDPVIDHFQGSPISLLVVLSHTVVRSP